jgi:5'-deoxynucleotidase YfbR-like HD superfamily hydrolase
MTQLTQQIRLAHRGGMVRRFHCHVLQHPENVGEHSHMVACLVAVYFQFRPSAQALMAALAHDLPEYKLGDIPSPVKRAMPGLSEAFEQAEAQVFKDHGWPEFPLTDEEQEVLKLADALSGYMTAFKEVRSGNTLMRDPLHGYERLVGRLIGTAQHLNATLAHNMFTSAGYSVDSVGVEV